MKDPFKNMAKDLKCFFQDIVEFSEAVQTSTANGVTVTYSITGSFPCAFYEGSSSERYISDKLETSVDGVIVGVPSDVTFTIKDSDKCTLTSTDRNFIVVHSDNIGLQDGGIVIYVKEDRSNG